MEESDGRRTGLHGRLQRLRDLSNERSQPGVRHRSMRFMGKENGIGGPFDGAWQGCVKKTLAGLELAWAQFVRISDPGSPSSQGPAPAHQMFRQFPPELVTPGRTAVALGPPTMCHPPCYQIPNPGRAGKYETCEGLALAVPCDSSLFRFLLLPRSHLVRWRGTPLPPPPLPLELPFRLNLPGHRRGKATRVPPEAHATQPTDQANPAATTTTDNVASPAVDNRNITVRLPKQKGKEKSPSVSPPTPISEPAPAEVETVPTPLPAEPEESLDEVFTVKPRPAPAPPILTIVPPLATEDPVAS